MKDFEQIMIIEKAYLVANKIEELSVEEKATVRECLEAQIKKDNEFALYSKYQSCYVGDGIYECDWDEAKKCLLRLIELTEKGEYYSRLGMIYLDGRCNNGVPQYDEAFECFSIGTAWGLYEPKCFLSDMYKNGYGCKKNLGASRRLITDIYLEMRARFCAGDARTEFPDVVYRLAKINEEGIDMPADIEEAYSHYLMARYANNIRLTTSILPEDVITGQKIEEDIARVAQQMPKGFFVDKVEYFNPGPIQDLLKNSCDADLIVKREDDRYYIEVKGMADETHVGNTLIVVPYMNYCQLKEKVRMYLVNPEFTNGYGDEFEGPITDLVINPFTMSWEARVHDREVYRFKCEAFAFEEQMPKFIIE